MNSQTFAACKAQADFIAELLGPETEVLVYDVREKIAVYAVNPLEDVQEGSPMGSPEMDYLAAGLDKKRDFVVNYRALSQSRHKLKSATLFLRDGEGQTAAVLTVNIRVDKYIELREMINVMIRGHHPEEQELGESLSLGQDVTFLEIMQKAILDELGKYTAAPNRLSYQERIRLIEALHKKGVFNVKGAVTELARLLETTETSIYRYLNKLPGDTGE